MPTEQVREEIETDIVIVGGGPVGMGLAIDLGQRGISCVVIERHAEPQRVPKGQNLTQRSGEHFRAWGVSKDIRAASPIPHNYGSAGLTAYESLLSGHHYDWFRRAEVRRFYGADNERLPQYCTEAVLRRRAGELASVKLCYDWTAVDAEQDGERVRVTATDPQGNECVVHGRFAVGCDGGRSIVRTVAGIDQDIDPHDKHMVLLVFHSQELNQLLQRFPGKSYFNILNPQLSGYWQFLGRVDLEGNWFFHAPVPAGTSADNFDFAAYLHSAVGASFAIEFEHIGFWDLRIATAKTYRDARIFIAGDAAHSHPPYGGFGINTGFEDVRNLGWKLAAQIEGWAGSDLLDSYGTERRPVFLSTAEDFIGRMIRDDRAFLERFDPKKDEAAFTSEWNRRASGGNADVVGFAPHYEGSPIVWGPADGVSSAAGKHDFAAKAGRHLAPQPLSNGEIDDAVRSGFAFLAIDGDPEVANRFGRAAADLDIPLTIITDTREDGREAFQSRYVLIRPDQFVAWTGQDAPDDPRAVLARTVGG